MKKIIHGKKVILRPLQQSDLPIRAWWTADRELCSLMGGTDENELRELSEAEKLQRNCEWLARRRESGAMPYAVEVDGRYIGDIDFGLYPGQGKPTLPSQQGASHSPLEDWGFEHQSFPDSDFGKGDGVE